MPIPMDVSTTTAIITHIHDAFHRYEEEQDREQKADDGCKHECLFLTANHLCEPRRQSAENHACKLTESHENSVVYDQFANGDVAVKAVGEHVSGCRISESVEEVGADACSGKVQPWHIFSQGPRTVFPSISLLSLVSDALSS